ncbi:MAG: hypothetical protein JWQ81_3514 [Amycolatopsis sp.]|nr:hypothetical protein [Amycolatopsis sp.]
MRRGSPMLKVGLGRRAPFRPGRPTIGQPTLTPDSAFEHQSADPLVAGEFGKVAVDVALVLLKARRLVKIVRAEVEARGELALRRFTVHECNDRHEVE